MYENCLQLFSVLHICIICPAGQQQGAKSPAFCAEPGFDDIGINTVQDLLRMDIAVQDGTGLFPDQGKEVLLLHDAAAENDLLRRESANGVGAHLGQICRFQSPGFMVLREILAGPEARPSRQPL